MSVLKRFLLKLALKKNIKLEGVVDNLAIGNWLFNSYKDKGFAHYNTLRKRMIHALMETGVEGKEYWIAVGRIKELQSLGLNIKDEWDRRNKKKKT